MRRNRILRRMYFIVLIKIEDLISLNFLKTVSIDQISKV
jgi:hypothetical protein